MAPSLLDLPRAIRERIYRFAGLAMYKENLVLLPGGRANRNWNHCLPSYATTSTLLRVCRTMTDEVAFLLYSTNTFYIRYGQSSDLQPLSRLSPASLRAMRSLRIHLNVALCVGWACSKSTDGGYPRSSIPYDRPLVGASTEGRKKLSDWHHAAQHIGAHILPNHLDLAFSCDYADLETARLAVDTLLGQLPPLAACSIRLGRHRNPDMQRLAEHAAFRAISELQAIAKDYFEWVNTQPSADAENGACIVSSFYDPTTSRVYSSTIPRDGAYRNEMQDNGAANAPVWFAAGGRATPYHAEDACYYDYEKENKQTTGKPFFPGGKMIASHGYLTARRKNSPGPVNNPCDDNNTFKRPSCSSVARSLHVKWKDNQEYADGKCLKTWTYNELDGNMYDEHGQVVGQNVLDESTGEVFFSTNAKKRSLAGRIELERRAGTTTVACVTAVSSSMSAGTTNTAATTSSGAAATTSAKDSSSEKAMTTSAASTTSAKAEKTTISAKAKETPKAEDTKKDKKKDKKKGGK